uniref:Uncharacterized protein n=1 Tax=Lepeophtheirus salmonis TaxID=72036 RepID=A0A0K2VJ40_LEPSM
MGLSNSFCPQTRWKCLDLCQLTQTISPVVDKIFTHSLIKMNFLQILLMPDPPKWILKMLQAVLVCRKIKGVFGY